MNYKKLSVGLVLACFLAILGSATATTNSNFTVYWSVASSYDHTISFNANCAGGTAYFVEADAVIDGNGWKLLPYDDASKTNKCQDETAAYFTVTITGTATTDLDINATNTNAKDVNAKIYLSTALTPFCGDDNCNGWQKTCTITAGTVTSTACHQLGTGNAEFYSNLASGASASFCMCADFAANGTNVPVGDWAEKIGVTSRAP